MKLIIDIDEEIYKSSKRECEETDDLIIDTFTFAIGNGTPIPDNATTLQQIIEKHNMVNLAYDEMSDFERDILKYLDAPYQKGGTNEKQM